MKKLKSNPGLKFFLFKKGQPIEKIPEQISGMHLLAKFLFNRFVTQNGFKPTEEGKFEFMKSVLDSEINNRFSAEEAIYPLATAISSSYDIRKNSDDKTLNTRDSVHIEYCIRKELETILITFNRILPAKQNNSERLVEYI